MACPITRRGKSSPTPSPRSKITQRDVERNIASGELNVADRARFEAEALSGVADGVAAARAPQRKLMRSLEAPPPFLPFPTRTPPGGRLCLALVTQDYPPGQNGGIARNVFELARAWVALGHHVHVFTRNRGAAPSFDFEDGVWVHRMEPQEGPPPPDLVAPETIPQPIWDHSRAMFEEVAELDARRKVDLVYAPLWDCEPVAFLCDPRFPLVCALQTTMDFWLDSQPQQRKDANGCAPAARRCWRWSAGFWRAHCCCTPTAAPSSRTSRAATI